MNLTDNEKYDLAAGAAFLHERLAGEVTLTGEPVENSKALLNRWEKAVIGVGDTILFDRRLAVEGADRDMAEKAVGKVIRPAGKDLPEWVNDICRVFDMLPCAAEDLLKKLPASVFSPESPLPFEEAWLPWVVYAVHCLKTGDEKYSAAWTPDAAAFCLRYLVKEFTRYFDRTLLAEFDLMRYRENPLPFIIRSLMTPASARAAAYPISAAALDSHAPAGENGLYRRFCSRLLEGGWRELALKRPVFARLLMSVIQNWSHSLSDLLQRLHADKDEIDQRFNRSAPAGRADRIDMFLSDRHNNGRTVMRVTFESGLKVIYKPRSLKIDRAWKSFLDILATRGLDTRIDTPLLIDKGDYGWVEQIENSGLVCPEEAGAFYRSCGMLLAIAYALGGNDLHQENLIARGSRPVVIDLETIIRPEARPFDYDEKKEAGLNAEISHRFWTKSVLNIRLLPIWTPVTPDVMRDFGALTPFDQVFYTIQDWQAINTDRMRPAPAPAPAGSSPNSPHFEGKIAHVSDYKDQVEEGFRAAYDFFTVHRDECVGDGGWLDVFKGCDFRLLARTTQTYADMIQHVTSPALLKDGAGFSCAVESLAPAFLRYAPPSRLPGIWSVFEAERGSICRLDTPIFYNHADDIGMYTASGKIVSDYFLTSALRTGREQILSMNPEDRDDQLKLIRSALSIRYPGKDI